MDETMRKLKRQQVKDSMKRNTINSSDVFSKDPGMTS